MSQNSDQTSTKTDDHEIIGSANQPAPEGIVGYANQPAPEGTVPNELDEDYVFKAGMETLKRLDELMVKVNLRVHKPIQGAEWLSTEAEDLRDRLVEAKKPVVELVNWIRVNGPPVGEEDNSMYLELFEHWKTVDPLISEADRWTGE
ncbi:hypothetical protein CEP54_015191 [Fusarium duplospermum]|uniref:Uncharacterized protein n=1 Tax=Fusarium duplospermum TaxID=1325734 RepID=A0A428NQY1_9HYPO|nr:hypothetical protein CEP54_015191 [Fusarium duplospermum]